MFTAAALLLVLSLSACGASEQKPAAGNANQTNSQETVPSASNTTENTTENETANTTETVYQQDSAALTLDAGAWSYDAEHDVYYQIGVSYCTTPAAATEETMSIYVPGAYMKAKDNGDGTFTCKVSNKKKVNGYTAETAPIVFPVDTPGYAAQKPAVSYHYDNVSRYVNEGFVYVLAGMRGRDNVYSAGKLLYAGGAPWGVTDLKAAVRCYRFNESSLPGNTDSIFVFGMSGGGGQSAVCGASGDSTLYTPYLEKIGAAMTDASGRQLSDAVCGVMCWCPVTGFDYADAAYEWDMGQYAKEDERSTSVYTGVLSDDLALAYADYVNHLGLKDENGTALTLEETKDGIFTKGTYYDYLKSVINKSLNSFLKTTTFPYKTGGKTYQTAEAYIAALNGEDAWITWDEKTKTAEITEIGAFVTHCRNAELGIGAFDALDLSTAENSLFGTEENNRLHFDAVMTKLLKSSGSEYSTYRGWDASVVKQCEEGTASVDALNTTSEVRQNMYNPMYFLCDYYDGAGSAVTAPHWRIRSGIEQTDTALASDVNLALALKNNSAVADVDFAEVWGAGHVEAEETGESTANFIAWVNQCTGVSHN